MKKIAAIILTYNDVDDTVLCINSLRQSSYPVDAFYVLDNGSHGEDVFQSLRTALQDIDSCRLLRSETNLGFSAGVNQCLRMADELNPDFFLLINNDAVIDRDCIQQLASSLDSREEALVCGPSILYHSEKNILWHGAGYFSRLKTAARNPGHNKVFPVSDSAAMDVDIVSGCVMLVKRLALEKIGFFDEEFFFYSEDIDYCLRVGEKGSKVLYAPRAIAYHKIDPTFENRANKFVYYHVARSKMVLARKHFGPLYVAMALGIQFFFGALQKAYRAVRSRTNPFPLLYAWYSGLRDGTFRPAARRKY